MITWTPNSGSRNINEVVDKVSELVAELLSFKIMDRFWGQCKLAGLDVRQVRKYDTGLVEIEEKLVRNLEN